MKSIAIFEHHIMGYDTNGHYLERVKSIAKVLSDSGFLIHLYSGADSSLCRLIGRDSCIDDIFFEPGFTSFLQPVFRCASGSDFGVIKLFKEAVNNLDLRFPLVFSDDEDKLLKIFFKLLSDPDFLRVFSSEVHSFYCSLPNETVFLCSLYLRLTGFSIDRDFLCDKRGLDYINKISYAWLRVKREKGALSNIFSERILLDYGDSYSALFFPTASISDLISGIRYVSNSGSGPVLTYVHHQPNDFTPSVCYAIKTELSRLSIGQRKKINFLLSCDEFKQRLSSSKFGFLGRDAEIAIGPFFQRNDLAVQEKRSFISPSVAAEFLLKKNNNKKWVLDAINYSNDFSISPKSVNADFFSSFGFKRKLNYFYDQGCIIFSFLGDIRDEKNFNIYVALVIDAWSKGVDLVAVHPSFFSDGVTEISRDAFDMLLKHPLYYKFSIKYEKPLAELDYLSVLKKSDVIFNAYDFGQYKYKQSGIFYEALLFGGRCCVSSCTAMAAFFGKKIFELSRKNLRKNLLVFSFVDNNLIENSFFVSNDFFNEFEVTVSDSLVDNFGVIFSLGYRIFDLDASLYIEEGFLTVQSGFSSSFLTRNVKKSKKIRLEFFVDDLDFINNKIEISVFSVPVDMVYYDLLEFASLCVILPRFKDGESVISKFNIDGSLFVKRIDSPNSFISDFREEFINESVSNIVKPFLELV